MLSRSFIRSFHSSNRALQTLSDTQLEVNKLLNKLVQMGKSANFQKQSFTKSHNLQRNASSPKTQFRKSNAASELGNEFKNMSENFKGTQDSIRSNYNNSNNRNRLTSKARRQLPKSSKQSNGAAVRLSVKSDSQKKTSMAISQKKANGSSNLPRTNPNNTVITTEYTPEIPTLEDLLINSPVKSLSHTADSKIIRLFKELKINDALDVTAVLRAQTESAKLDLSHFAKSSGLKANAQIVLNALNKNNSIPFHTKLRLVKPLTGLESIKSLP